MLQGAKRASRIEFGAHQVVIVRNEEAKKSLPDEFGIDPDWVMTVQESKGLEFDDVLLYNFFSDSPAGGKKQQSEFNNQVVPSRTHSNLVPIDKHRCMARCI